MAENAARQQGEDRNYGGLLGEHKRLVREFNNLVEFTNSLEARLIALERKQLDGHQS